MRRLAAMFALFVAGAASAALADIGNAMAMPMHRCKAVCGWVGMWGLSQRDGAGTGSDRAQAALHARCLTVGRMVLHFCLR